MDGFFCVDFDGSGWGVVLDFVWLVGSVFCFWYELCGVGFCWVDCVVGLVVWLDFYWFVLGVDWLYLDFDVCWIDGFGFWGIWFFDVDYVGCKFVFDFLVEWLWYDWWCGVFCFVDWYGMEFWYGLVVLVVVC